MKTIAIAVTLAAFFCQAGAQEIQWKPIGQRDDYRIEWASNLVQHDGGEVMTMMRMVYQREDAAPNNARFNNEQIGITIRCEQRTYFTLGRSYHMGTREVYSQSLAGVGAYEPVAGTFVARFVDEVCRH